MYTRFAALLAGALSLLVAHQSAFAKDRWYEVTSPHFVVISNDKEKDALEVAVHFEEVRDLFQRAFRGARIGERRLQILAVKNEKSMNQLFPRMWKDRSVRPSGVFRNDGTIALRTDGRRPNRYSAIYHEYFHSIVDLNAPGLPSWLNEGMASYWENTTFEHDRIVAGQPSAFLVRLLRENRPIPLDELFTTNPASHGRRATMFYAQSWALAHYFIVGDRQIRAPLLQKYIALTHEGNTSLEAAQEAFGDLDTLAKQLRRYSKRRTFSAMGFRRSADVDQSAVSVRQISEAESLAVRGYFLVRGGDRDDGEKLLQEAVSEEPIPTIASEAMGWLAARRGDDEAADRWLARAAAAQDATFMAHYLHAQRLPDTPEKESAFLETIRLERSFAPAYVELAFYYAEVDDTLERSLAMVRAAADHDPSSAENRLLIARVLRKMGARNEASTTARDAVRLAVWSRTERQTNNVCWFGSLTGFAREVLEACELSVKLHPDSPGSADSRGVARAMLGNYAGAVSDFEALVEAGDPRAEIIENRRHWIAQLEQGVNPFDEATLARLLDLRF